MKSLVPRAGYRQKLAQRIILELKDKVLKALGSELSQDMDGFEPDSMNAGARRARFRHLWCSVIPSRRRAAVARVAPDVTATEEIIKLALKMT